MQRSSLILVHSIHLFLMKWRDSFWRFYGEFRIIFFGEFDS
uniref:Uncharacterized protein n=1 Tax=Populus trichocarpa TaxID=3694 RepID=A0A3N7FRS5_POPTR